METRTSITLNKPHKLEIGDVYLCARTFKGNLIWGFYKWDGMRLWNREFVFELVDFDGVFELPYSI